MTDQDARAAFEAGEFDKLAHDENPFWRGLALLTLKRSAEAAQVLETAEGARDSSSVLELAGAALWLSGDRQGAVERWIAALEAGHETPADAVRAPALLLYAGQRLDDDRYLRRGTRLLGKLWKPKLASRWPGPVAGYLLGELDEARFLGEGFEDEVLEARRLTAAHFWVGVRSTGESARAHFRAAIEQEGAAVLEVEHHLAQGELQRD